MARLELAQFNADLPLLMPFQMKMKEARRNAGATLLSALSRRASSSLQVLSTHAVDGQRMG